MAGFLEPHPDRSSSTRSTGLSLRDQVRVNRSLSRLEQATLLRLAAVQAEGLVQVQKLREADHLGRVAMTGHAMLVKWADSVAAGDPLLRDELKFFTDICRLGKGEVIADTIDTFCRESRR